MMTTAALLGGVLLGLIATALGLHMRRVTDPAVLLLATALTALPTAIAIGALPEPAVDVAQLLVSAWTATILGSLFVMASGLSYRAVHNRKLALECAVVVAAAVAAISPFTGRWFADLGVGFLAWCLLPLLLLFGRRYGLFAAGFTASALSFSVMLVLLRNPVTVESAPVWQRQVVGCLLVCVVLSVLILLREQRESLARLRTGQEVANAFLANADPIWYIKSVTPTGTRYEELGGGSFRGWRDIPTVTDESLFGVETANELAIADAAVVATGVGSVGIEELRIPDGTRRQFLSNRFPIKAATGEVVAIGGIRTDVTNREKQAALQQEQGKLLEAMFISSPVPTMRVTRTAADELQVATVNHALAALIGRTREDVNGGPVAPLIDESDWARVSSLFVRKLILGREVRWNPQAEVRLHTQIGGFRLVLVTVAPLTQNEYLVHLEDVTARRAAEEAVARYSLFDSTTGLLNRLALGDRLDAALHRIANDGAGVALIVLDIDDFKGINDTHGHSVGDQILIDFGRRLRDVCEDTDAVARLGADEFAIVTSWSSSENLGLLVGRLKQVLTFEMQTAEATVTCTSAFGVAVTKSTNLTGGELMRQAELALFRAKRGGRGQVEFYAASMRAQAQAVLNVRKELSRAISDDSFQINYQPLVRLSDGEVVDYEALIRLPTSDGRLLTPVAFLDVARSAGLLPVMDQMTVRKALADVSAGRLPVPGAGVSINAEADDLRDREFAVRVLRDLDVTGVDPRRLTVEVTESALLQLDDAVLANVRALREVGVVIAIDDFGTGYSSLAQLRHLAVDIIKIDRSFVIEMESDVEAAHIVATVINLAHSLGLIAVAEGIETRGQAEALGKLSCDRGQGYLFGAPEPLVIIETSMPTQPTGRELSL